MRGRLEAVAKVESLCVSQGTTVDMFETSRMIPKYPMKPPDSFRDPTRRYTMHEGADYRDGNGS